MKGNGTSGKSGAYCEECGVVFVVDDDCHCPAYEAIDLYEESYTWERTRGDKGGECIMRGSRDRLIDTIDRIADEAKRRVMDPKNLAKGDGWREMSWDALFELAVDEASEFERAVERADGDPIWEAGDKLVVDAMRVDKADVSEAGGLERG